MLLPNIAGFGSDTKRVESPTFLKTMVVKPFLRPPVEDDSPLEPLGPAALQEALNAVAPALKRTTASDPRSRDRDQKRDVVKAGEPFGIGSSLSLVPGWYKWLKLSRAVRAATSADHFESVNFDSWGAGRKVCEAGEAKRVEAAWGGRWPRVREGGHRSPRRMAASQRGRLKS